MRQIETDVVPDNDTHDGPPVSHQILCDLSKRGIKALHLFVHNISLKGFPIGAQTLLSFDFKNQWEKQISI